MQKVLLIALAGATGTIARYYTSQLAHFIFGASFPWGTLTVNVLGSLLFGFLWALSDRALGLSLEMKSIILVGFMGSFTTFSTFAFDAGTMIKNAQWAAMMIYIGGSVLTGVSAFFIGNAAGSRI